MTQPPPLPPPTPPSSPFGDDTDEALSALVDGELAAFAADHGITEADALDRLEQWEEYPSRIAALEQTRAALAAPVPPLDDLTRRRLIRDALPAARDAGGTPRRSGWTWQRISAAAAAAIIVLAGLGAIMSSFRTEGDKSANSTAGGGSTASDSAARADADRGDLGNLGDVSDPAIIRDLLQPGAAESPEAAPDAPENQSRLSQGRDGGSVPDPAGSTVGPAAGGQADSSKTAPTPAACAAQLAGTRPVRFFATGTYQGQPVTIIGIDAGGRTIAFVVPVNDCTTVLTSISR